MIDVVNCLIYSIQARIAMYVVIYAKAVTIAYVIKKIN